MTLERCFMDVGTTWTRFLSFYFCVVTLGDVNIIDNQMTPNITSSGAVAEWSSHSTRNLQGDPYKIITN